MANKRDYVVCPRCKTMEIKLYEVFEAIDYWEQDKDGNLLPGPNTSEIGAVLRVEGECLDQECKYRWRVRGVNNITELPNWEENTKDPVTSSV